VTSLVVVGFLVLCLVIGFLMGKLESLYNKHEYHDSRIAQLEKNLDNFKRSYEEARSEYQDTLTRIARVMSSEQVNKFKSSAH
jgi:uncharacterized membrane-anchored protein YhcB (DUF1043 family)